MSELKPCPFCGGEARLNAYGFGQYSVECVSCWVETQRKAGAESAIKVWNRRVENDRER